jgi:hypothetical protein
MASLWALLTATQAAGAFTWLTRLARGLGADDPRSMDTRRADILAALLTGRPVTNPDTDATPDAITSDATTPVDPTDHSDSTGDTPTGEADTTPGDGERGAGDGRGAGGSPDRTDGVSDSDRSAGGAVVAAGPGRPIQPVNPGKPLIEIVIPYTTLIGADDQPADLVGHGPIPACLARETAADGIWRRLVTDPLSGTLLDHGRTTYHPPTGLADHIRARDLHCRFNGCRKQATDAEIDHITAWSDGGTTSEPNLAAYCTHHHRLKTHADGWRVHAHPDGSLRWTTPTGHRHTTEPHDYRPEPAESPPSPPPAPARDDSDPDPPPF